MCQGPLRIPSVNRQTCFEDDHMRVTDRLELCDDFADLIQIALEPAELPDLVAPDVVTVHFS